jgi:hypothetical protein
VDEPSLAFVIVDPFTFFPDYEVLLSREDLEALEATELGNLAVFSVVVIPENPEDMTANLRGPVLINVEKKIARQVVLNDERYSPHQPILETVRGAMGGMVSTACGAGLASGDGKCAREDDPAACSGPDAVGKEPAASSKPCRAVGGLCEATTGGEGRTTVAGTANGPTPDAGGE